MQVHKEAIDKVPNSLPNRSNIEIEIYGMEGIPSQDLKDHERQKTGNGNKSESEDEEPQAKRNKVEPTPIVPNTSQMPPQMMMHQQHMMHPGMMNPQMMNPLMMPCEFH